VGRALDASRYGTDKAGFPLYLRYYQEYFEPLWDREVKLLPTSRPMPAFPSGTCSTTTSRRAGST
jgi:hypothetical protein